MSVSVDSRLSGHSLATVVAEAASHQLSLGIRVWPLEPHSLDMNPASDLYSVTLGKLPNLLTLQFPYVQNKGNKIVDPLECVRKEEMG